MKKEKIETIRFTTTIQPQLLSQLKLISYFLNKKLNETINESVSNYIRDFENKSNTSITSLINLQNNFENLELKFDKDLDIKNKDKESKTT